MVKNAILVILYVIALASLASAVVIDITSDNCCLVSNLLFGFIGVEGVAWLLEKYWNK
jgi:hypothetical protein